MEKEKKEGKQPRLFMTVGLPSSGKSTIADLLRGSMGYCIVCPDDIREAMGAGTFVPQLEDFVWTTARLAVRSMLLRGQDVMVDATNVTRARRSEWRRLAEDCGASVSIIRVDVSLEECLERNVSRGKKKVPEKTILRMAEALEEPGQNEGHQIKTRTIGSRWSWLDESRRIIMELTGATGPREREEGEK